MVFCRRLVSVLLMVLPTLVFANSALIAEPEWRALEIGSRYYQFEQLELASEDQQRHYQITLATPKAAMPKNGYPVLYMLDGGAALAALNEQRLSRLQGNDWPVMVTIGYKEECGQSDKQNVRAARAYDYTPAPVDNALVAKGRRYGGAEGFGQFIEQDVKPKIAQRVPIDVDRQSLWGHSFSGLFVLHTLFNYPDSFQTYIAADASLWWQQGAILKAEARYRQRRERPQAQLLIQRSASHRAGSTLPDDASRRLAERLSKLPALAVQYHEYFEQDHGSILAASIPSALRMAQGREYE